MILQDYLHNDWRKALSTEFSQPYFKQLSQFLQQEYETHTVYPPINDVFRALNLCPLSDVKVVIVGQDPYHGEGQAQGLCFSVNKAIKLPPSLKNISKELNNDIQCALENGDLTHWAEQGILLINTVLTVRQNSANSHRKKGWEQFTAKIIENVSKKIEPVVFLLWGKPAQQHSKLIEASHLILTAPHPSPLSAHRGFFGCKHFSQTNAILKQNGHEIRW